MLGRLPLRVSSNNASRDRLASSATSLRAAASRARLTPDATPYRHSYATTLLSGGMSLVGLMRLLGHLSYQTTQRYAAITQETIGREYFEALDQLEQRYGQQLRCSTNGAEDDPRRSLRDVARWLDKHVAHERGQPRVARRLIKRIRRLEAEIQQLIKTDGRG